MTKETSKKPRRKSNIFTIETTGITKRFNKNLLFKDLAFSIKTGESLAVTGPNGSGKSTLLEIISGIQKSIKGKIEYRYNEEVVASNEIFNYIGFSSPLINPYSELTGLENILFACGSRKNVLTKTEELLERFDLYKHKNKCLKRYSSGMKQRLKFLIAILGDPPVLLLDEPGTNLDRKGKDLIYSYIDSVKEERLIVIATNEDEEAMLCHDCIYLGT